MGEKKKERTRVTEMEKNVKSNTDLIGLVERVQLKKIWMVG